MLSKSEFFQIHHFNVASNRYNSEGELQSMWNSYIVAECENEKRKRNEEIINLREIEKSKIAFNAMSAEQKAELEDLLF